MLESFSIDGLRPLPPGLPAKNTMLLSRIEVAVVTMPLSSELHEAEWPAASVASQKAAGLLPALAVTRRPIT